MKNTVLTSIGIAVGVMGIAVTLLLISTNELPQAVIKSLHGTEFEIGERITFSAEGSRDPDGSIIKYGWDFGDGTYGEGFLVEHVYLSKGDKEVELRVTDNESRSSIIKISIIENQSGPTPEPVEEEPKKELEPTQEELFKKGKFHYNVEEYFDAIKALRQVSKEYANYQEAQFVLGKSYYNTDQFEQAKVPLSNVQFGHANYQEAQFVLGKSEYEIGNCLGVESSLNNINGLDSPNSNYTGKLETLIEKCKII